MVYGDSVENTAAYFRGMADGLDASAKVAEALREHYRSPGTRAALGLLMDALREQSAQWRQIAGDSLDAPRRATHAR